MSQAGRELRRREPQLGRPAPGGHDDIDDDIDNDDDNGGDDGERRGGGLGCSAPGGLINDLLSFYMHWPNNDRCL